MEPVSTALHVAFNFAGKKLLDVGYKKLTDKAVNDEQYALLTALTTLRPERQAAGRTALQGLMASTEWRTGNILEQLKEGDGVTASLLNHFEQRAHGLEAQDRPRVLAEAFLMAYWLLHLKGKGMQVLLDKGTITYELLRDVQREVQVGFETVVAQQHQTLQLIREVHAQLNTGGDAASTVHLAGTPVPPSDLHARKLERIDHSLEDFALAAAGRHLRALEADAGQMSDAARAKYLRLWGNLENNLGHPTEAAQLYKDAFEYDSTSPGGLTLRGYAALLTGEPEQALTYLDRALGKQRRSDALALKVYALEELDRFGDIETLRAQGGDPADLEFVLALAQAAMGQGRYDVASADLGPLLATEHAEDARVKLALARVKIKPLELELQREPRAAAEVPALLEDRPEIAEALDLVTGVLAEPGGVAPPLLTQAGNLQQAILFWQNRFPELLEATQAALNVDPGDVPSLRHAALAQLALNRPEDAWQTFTRIPEPERDVEVRTLGASAAERTGRAQEAADLLTGILQGGLEGRERENAVLMAARVLVTLDRHQAAQEMLDLEADDSALTWLARAEVAVALEDHGHATEGFRQAVELADGDRVVGLSLQFAAYLRDQGQLDQAAEVLEAVVDQTNEPADLHRMGSLLVEAGAFPAARRIVDVLDAQQDVSFETLALATNVYASLEQWALAAERQVYLLEMRPTDIQVLWNAVVVRHALGQTGETLTLLRRFVACAEVTARELMLAADLASSVEPGLEALNWAYQARRRDYGNPAMHVKYLEIATRCPHDHDLPTVQPESAVLLDYEDNEDTQRWVVLTADEAPSRDQGEFALDSREARLLLGQPLGGKVKLREGEGGTYEVRAIITKFANAERFFFQDFHQLFPADNSMVTMRVFDPRPDADTGLPEEWQKLRKTTEKMARQRAEAGQVIAQNRYAHVLNATLNLESASAFWQEVFRRPDASLNFTGDPADVQAADAALSAQAWVVDVSALLSLAVTDQLDVLLLAGVPLQVTAQTVSQLGAQNFQQEPVARALHFVRTHTAVVSAPPSTGRLDSVFPEDTASAMALAAAQALPLLTEDAGFRHSTRDGTLGPVLTCFSVVDLLLALRRTGTLDQPTLDAHLRPLLLAGRLFLPLSGGLMQQAVLHDAGQVGPGLQAITQLLLHPNVTLPYQAGTAGELLKLLWTQPDLGGRRQAVVRQLVDGLDAFGDRTERFKALYQTTRSLFRLLPQQAGEVTGELQKARATWEHH